MRLIDFLKFRGLAGDGNAAHYLDGSGAYSTPSGGGGSGDVVGPASATANALVQYNGTTGKLIKDGPAFTDAGTFTPTLTFGGASVGMTYSLQEGHYTRIGNRVFFDLNVILTAKGSSTGTATVNALPFANAATSNVALTGQYNNVTLGSNLEVQQSVGSGATAVSFSLLNSGTVSGVTETNFTNTAVIRLAGHYPI